jgi:hypothetical protein
LVGEYLRRRRSRDCGSVTFYLEDPHPRYANRTGEILRIAQGTQPHQRETIAAEPLVSDNSRLTAPIDCHRNVQALAEGPLGPLLSLTEALTAENGARHIFVVLDRLHDGVWDLDEIAESGRALLDRGVELHCFATRRTPTEGRQAFRRLCAKSGGSYYEANSVEAAVGIIADVVAALYRRYRLSVAGGWDAEFLQVEVNSARFHGSASWPEVEEALSSPQAAA